MVDNHITPEADDSAYERARGGDGKQSSNNTPKGGEGEQAATGILGKKEVQPLITPKGLSPTIQYHEQNL